MNKSIHLLACYFFLSYNAVLAKEADCGEARFSRQIALTASTILTSEPIEPTVGELPTVEGNPECVRVTFRLTPGGTPWDVGTSGSSGNIAFNLAAMQAFVKYRFDGSWWGFWKEHMVVLKGVDNKRPPNWTPRDH